MTSARSKLVDPNVSRWYHCTTRCVRQAFLLSKGFERKAWLQERLREVSDVFAIAVAGFAIMDNHIHFLVRLDPAIAEQWTPEEVVKRWAMLHPPKVKRKNVEVTKEWIATAVQDCERVEVLRKRLVTLGWFMKEVKEPLARLANIEDGCKGTFFEGRYKSIALLDDQAVLAACAYIDLNPVAAGLTDVPEKGPYTSLKQRVDYLLNASTSTESTAFLGDQPTDCLALERKLDELWLIPIEDKAGARREGMIQGFTLAHYLLLIEYTGRLHRPGKASLSPDLESVFERLGVEPSAWGDQLSKLSAPGLTGRFLASSRQRLREAALQLGAHHCVNLNGCFAA